MVLQSISLQNIRSYFNYKLELEAPALVVVGGNATGKTTILEAILLATTGESFRAGEIAELIKFNAELGRLEVGLLSDTVEVIVTRGSVQGKKTIGRLFSVNGVRRRRKDAMGRVYPVLFRPEDMRLIEGSPARRRLFLDAALCVFHQEYRVAHKVYEQTLRRRNKLLTQVRDREQPASALTYWNLGMVKHGEVLQKFRQQFLQSYAAHQFALPFTVRYEPSVISAERQAQYLPREIAAGHSLIGPHKDDYMVFLPLGGELRSIAAFGSRGQQRLAVLWLKLGELRYAERQQLPVILLLDDILSELDTQSREHALALIPQYQSIITSTDRETLEMVAAVQPSVQLVET
ncbi:DNA replication/repair protein RecF [Candidatus Woesebacteria bacterium]|nr:DNA replication/repair protein RecF [Candidatus Woesebacteria bacterium]